MAQQTSYNSFVTQAQLVNRGGKNRNRVALVGVTVKWSKLEVLKCDDGTTI